MSLPTYSLKTIKNDLRNGNYVITSSALRDSISLGFDSDDIINIGLNLLDNDFYKTMEAIKFPDRMQDVYRTKYNGINIYYKVQITGKSIVISCKEL